MENRKWNQTGFRFDEPSDESETDSAYDSDDYPSTESLRAKLPPHMQTTDYVSVDNGLATKETDDDMTSFISSEVSEALTDEEEHMKKRTMPFQMLFLWWLIFQPLYKASKI